MAYKAKREREFERVQNESALTLYNNLGSSDCIPQKIQFNNGREIQITTNAYNLDFKPNTIIQYDVQIEPEILQERIIRSFVYDALCGKDAGPMSQNELWKDVIFDGGHMMYSRRDNLERLVEVIPRSKKSEAKPVKVTIKKVGVVDKDNVNAILHIFGVAFQNAYNKMGYQKYMRKWVDPRSVEHDGSFSFIKGFVPSFTALSSGNSYIINATTKIERTCSLYQLIEGAIRNKSLRSEVQKSLASIDISLKGKNKTRTLRNPKIMWDMRPQEKTFPIFNAKGEVERNITVAEYFFHQYNHECQENDVCIEEKRMYKGKMQENLYPASALVVVGIMDSEKKTSLMKVISKHTRMNMHERKNRVNDFIRRITGDPRAKEFLDRWGFNISGSKETVGKLIQPPVLKFGNRNEGIGNYHEYKVSSGLSLSRKPEFETSPLFVGTNGTRELMEKLIAAIEKISGRLQFPTMTINKVFIQNTNGNEYRRAIIKEINSERIPSYVLCLLPDENKDRYEAIKDLLTVKLGIPSQCVLKSTIMRSIDRLESIATNLAIQIACKCSGSLCKIDRSSLNLRHTMVIGLSISLSKRSKTSVAAVANYDNEISLYYSDCNDQDPVERVVSPDFCTQFLENAIEKWRETNGDSPRRIVVYREGASYGQMPEIREKEVKAFQEVINNEIPEASLTYIICQKHGALRIMEKKERGVDNCSAGTVVTEGIGVKGVAEFYLVSHKVTQGAANPTRYTIIYSNPVNVWEDDHLITLTHYLTSIYPNWQGTIRIPAVLMLAGRLAEYKSTYISEVPNERLKYFLHYL